LKAPLELAASARCCHLRRLRWWRIRRGRRGRGQGRLFVNSLKQPHPRWWRLLLLLLRQLLSLGRCWCLRPRRRLLLLRQLLLLLLRQLLLLWQLLLLLRQLLLLLWQLLLLRQLLLLKQRLRRQRRRPRIPVWRWRRWRRQLLLVRLRLSLLSLLRHLQLWRQLLLIMQLLHLRTHPLWCLWPHCWLLASGGGEAVSVAPGAAANSGDS
jgi:hypothetical protein